MKLDNCYFLEYLDYCPHLYYYTCNVSVYMSFGLLLVVNRNGKVYPCGLNETTSLLLGIFVLLTSCLLLYSEVIFDDIPEIYLRDI